jgi:hypothetical protein
MPTSGGGAVVSAPPGARLLDVPGLLAVVTDVPLASSTWCPLGAGDDLDGTVAGVGRM